MGMPSFTIDQYVIKKDEDKMTEKGLKDVVNETLKGGRCISKAKGPHQELTKVVMGMYASFMRIW
jgi:hypothetical protein